MLVLDSSVWIDWLRNRATAQVAYIRSDQDEQTIIVPDLVLYEVLAGAGSERHADSLEEQMRVFDIVPTIDPPIARYAATIYRTLRGLGITVRSPMDTLISAFCIVNGHSLLHNDRDFIPIAKHCGLRVIDPGQSIH